MIAEAGIAGCDHATTAFHEAPHIHALCLGHRGKIGQDEQRQPVSRRLTLNIIGVDGQIRNAGVDKRLGYAPPGLFHEHVGIVAPVKVVVQLRPDNADRRQRAAVDQEFFVRLVPAHDRLGGAISAAVFLNSAHVVPPRLNAAGKSFQHP